LGQEKNLESQKYDPLKNSFQDCIPPHLREYVIEKLVIAIFPMRIAVASAGR
jgi:hypothetical protein